MAKVTINGEVFNWDTSLAPLSEALAVERLSGQRFDDWQADMRKGSVHALSIFIWLVWKRNGRDVDYAALERGEIEVDMNLYKLEPDEGDARADEDADGPQGPTGSGPEATSTTGAATSPRSASSASARGRSKG